VARRRVWARIEGLPLGKDLSSRRGKDVGPPGPHRGVGCCGCWWPSYGWFRPRALPIRLSWPSGCLRRRHSLVQTLLGLCPRDHPPRPCAPAEAKRLAWRWPVVPASSSIADDPVLELGLGTPALGRAAARPGSRFPIRHPASRFSVSAGPYVITVVGPSSTWAWAMNRVSVEVEEGVVEVWRGASLGSAGSGGFVGGCAARACPPVVEHRAVAGERVLPAQPLLRTVPRRFEKCPASMEWTEARSAPQGRADRKTLWLC